MKKEFDWFDKPKNIKKMRVFFYLSLVILVVLDLVIHKHPHYDWERFPGSYAVYGFLSCVVIVAVSKTLGKIWLQKKEDYYE